ncbi:MAG: GNAT family N-acetyltransferase [Anaerolineae bacterium]
MSELMVRIATLDDTAAITAVHTSNVERWQRLTEDGQVLDVTYDDLRIYERWLYGGPWMSVETCAVHLAHLRRGAGIPVVAVLDGRVVGHAEAYPGSEPPPFGQHLHIAVLYVHADYAGRGVEQALLSHMLAQARELGNERVCILSPEAREFYSGEGWRQLAVKRVVSWPAHTGQVFYQATPHSDANPDQIAGWRMPLGRGQSALQEWEMRWPALWDAVPELRARRVERFKFNVAGTSIFVMYEESRFDPRWAHVYVWSNAPFSNPMLTAINDKAHRLGFRRLEATVVGSSFAFLGSEAEAEGEPEGIFSIELG